jgi:hypothetical protein
MIFMAHYARKPARLLRPTTPGREIERHFAALNTAEPLIFDCGLVRALPPQVDRSAIALYWGCASIAVRARTGKIR